MTVHPKFSPHSQFSPLSTVCAQALNTPQLLGARFLSVRSKRDARSKLPLCSYRHVTAEVHRYKDALHKKKFKQVTFAFK